MQTSRAPVAHLGNTRAEARPLGPFQQVQTKHADKPLAEAIEAGLAARSNILMDRNHFELSRSTQPEMMLMVGDADVVLVLLSPDSVVSEALRFEVTSAFARERYEQRKALFAAMICQSRPMPEWAA